MKIFFIRHTKAVDRTNWLKDDMLRPLSDGGLKTAKQMFRAFNKIYDSPDIVYTSEALRARESADVFCKYSSASKLLVTSLLNPGFDTKKFNKLIALNPDSKSIAIFGHEPDFGVVISSLLKSEEICVDIKKCSVAEIELIYGKAKLLSLIPPKVLV